MPQSILKALNYNENKVAKGHAEFIYAGNFLKDAGQLNFYNKWHHFEKIFALNERAKVNTLHISLNFDPSEKPSKELLTDIALVYMQKIGFAAQPFLVYEHRDAGHPHIHIVTTNIRLDGNRIPIHNIGRNQSAKARVEIENEYGLIKASGKKQLKPLLPVQAVNFQKAQYGKADTRRRITGVLEAVLNPYKYTSLPEFNAVLKKYNVLADPGEKESRIYKNKGLVYRILDEKGRPIGVPVKASAIYSKPTLGYLEKKFAENSSKRQSHEKRLRTAIDWTLAKSPSGLEAFTRALEKERVHTVVHQNDQGSIYDLTFIDHQTRCVFNGSDLGKPYSAKTVLERCGHHQSAASLPNLKGIRLIRPHPADYRPAPLQMPNVDLVAILQLIMAPKQQNGFTPSELKASKRKKRKKISPH